MTPELAALTDILAQENAALASMNLPAAVALLNQKHRAVAALAQARLDRPTAERLRTLATENKRLLEAAMTVQGRVVELVAGAMPKSPRYNAAGSLTAPRRMPPFTLSARA